MTQIEKSERNSQIIQLAKEGKTAEYIAECFSMKKVRVQSILKSFKVKPGKISHALECESAQKIIQELEAGEKQCNIARKLKVSRQYVNQVKNSYNLIKESKKDTDN